MLLIITILFLYIANCGDPELLSTVSNDSFPNVVGFDDLIPVEGTSIMFSCPPGLVLNGSDTSTCMENGKWEPDPSGLVCTLQGKIFHCRLHKFKAEE